MSQLRTILPVDISSVVSHLPDRSTVLGVTLLPDHSGVEIVWCNDEVKTGRTYPVDYPIEKLLAAKKLTVDSSAQADRRKRKI